MQIYATSNTHVSARHAPDGAIYSPDTFATDWERAIHRDQAARRQLRAGLRRQHEKCSGCVLGRRRTQQSDLEIDPVGRLAHAGTIGDVETPTSEPDPVRVTMPHPIGPTLQIAHEGRPQSPPTPGGMSNTSTHVDTRAKSRVERLQPWIAALISALVHVLMLLILLSASKPTVTKPQGAASGGRMKVDLVGKTLPPEQPAKTPPSPPPQAHKPARTRPAASPVRSTLVRHSDNPLPPDTDTLTTSRPPTTAPRSDEWLPVPSRAQNEAAPSQAQAPAASPAPTQRRPETWGRPPGMLERDVADADDGQSNNPGTNQGYRNDRNTGEPSMEVGGYQVYYDQRSETQLRAWKEQGMTEIAIILPGTQYRMICPLETALRRGSGKCRLLAPDSPELEAIGDAREVINMMQVYHRGESVWRGPGPYR